MKCITTQVILYHLLDLNIISYIVMSYSCSDEHLTKAQHDILLMKNFFRSIIDVIIFDKRP